MNLRTPAKIGLLVAMLFSVVLPSHAASEKDNILAARDAFRNGAAVKLAQARVALSGSPLEHWAEYWQLRQRVDAGENAGVADFIRNNEGSYLADKLRGDWLRQAAKREQWDGVLREYPKLVQPELELTCYHLQARLARQEAAALEDGRVMWLTNAEQPESCRPVADALVRAAKLSEDDIWQRVRRLFEMKKPGQAREAARYLPDAQIPDPRSLAQIADKPSRYLDKLPANFAANRRERELAIYALQLVARGDRQEAAARWQRLGERFPVEERSYANAQLGLILAQGHAPQALSLFVAAGDAAMNEDQRAWQVRAALRAGDWEQVKRAIERMPAALASQPDWEYWLGRAYAAQGRREEARARYQKIAMQANFYGNLAADELGIPITVPPRAAAPTTEEMKAAANNPGLTRALALIRVDLRTEGVREWNWSLRNLDDRQLLAAAELAQRNKVYDRAISAALRTQMQHDYSLRYPAPFREQVQPKAQKLGLDDAWVYGLMRQESRFVMQAKSSVGAQGLMQVMPSTAKWVAKKIGLSGYSHSQASELETNIVLGTNYMKMVLGGLDNHPVLASAAYNAGPGRAKRWCAERPMEGAIYAETIPFSETRDYVKKVMSNAVYYAALFDEKPQSLKARLGTVRPRVLSDSGADALP